MSESADLKQMIMSLRVSELQVLLGYAGRNKHGRKHELLTHALHLLKSGCSPAVHMKIKELYCRRFPAKMLSHPELAMSGPHHPATAGLLGGGGAALPAGLTQLAYEGHAGHGGAPSPAALLPLSLLGPGHQDVTGLTHHLSGSASVDRVHPDVKLQRLPFYDLLDVLIKPISLASDSSQQFQETCFTFALTLQQVQQINNSMDVSTSTFDFSVQVQLRFCLSDTSCPQEDHFPSNLCVKVNGKLSNLPGYLPPTKNGVEPKRPSRPINVTPLVRLCTSVLNTIVVSWTAEIGRNFVMAAYLVRQQSSSVLLQRLQTKGIRNPDLSRALIKEKLKTDPDSEIAMTSLRVSLICPLGKMRLTIPCRALACAHLQCFDATLYIQMNEKKPSWVCPVCDKKAPYEHLIVDGLFVEILNSCSDCEEIQFMEDGSWAPMSSKKEAPEVPSASIHNGLEGSCWASAGSKQKSSPSPSHSGCDSNDGNSKVQVIDLTLDSSSEDEGQESPALRPPPANHLCSPMSPTSPPVVNKGLVTLQHQASPVSRTPSIPAMDNAYIPPVPPLIQDYRPYYHTPNDLSELNFFSFLQGDSHQHYNMVMSAASDDSDLLFNRFLPYSNCGSSASSQLFLGQSGASSVLPANGASNSSSSSSSLVSSSSLRDTHSSSSHSSNSHPGMLAGQSGAEAAVAAIYGGIPDIISLE
ncbi:E3 SUMO-protein ligase PIAS1-like [Neosynchiropus ocellatus]